MNEIEHLAVLELQLKHLLRLVTETRLILTDDADSAVSLCCETTSIAALAADSEDRYRLGLSRLTESLNDVATFPMDSTPVPASPTTYGRPDGL